MCLYDLKTSLVQNHRLIDTYRADTATKLDDLSRISTKPETFNATRCSACPDLLDLPTVHFLCKHSFHQNCLNAPSSSNSFPVADSARDQEGAIVECPICAPQNAMIRDIRKAQVESAGMHELFVDALGRSKDRFGTVSEWFGRGVMSGGTQ
jgi:vacuolar protein sorting-associated protein 11